MFSNPLVRLALAPGALLLGGALLVAGCGGGGGGTSVPTATPGPTATPTPTPIPGTVFSDEFNAGALDTAKWTTLGTDSTIQRTEFGNQPDFGQDTDGTRFMRVKLDTFLPDGAARAQGTRQFFGTEVAANQKVPLSGAGIVYEARIRVSNPEQQGLVGGFFAFGANPNGSFGGTPPYSFDEIDHELLTTSFAAAKPYTWTNIYNDFRIPQPGFPSGDNYGDKSRTNGLSNRFPPNYNPSGWNTYRMVWQATQVQWFINDQLIRSDPPTAGPLPNDPMGVRFNIWAASSPAVGGWVDAYSDTLQPAATAAASQTYSVDVDWVRLRVLSASTTSPATHSAALSLVPASRAELRQSGAAYQSGQGR